MSLGIGTIAWVALGGALGAVARFGLQSAAARIWPHAPVGTFAANLVGCLVAGLCAAWFARDDWARSFVLVGFLGALTTLSSLSLEVVGLVAERRLAAAALHWAAGAVLCVTVTSMGIWVGGRLAS